MAQTICPRREECGLHRTMGSAALRVWQSFYCEGMYGRCERHKLAESGRPVPERLLPNGRLVDAADARAAAGSRSEQAA